jgi:dihydrofolate reductase
MPPFRERHPTRRNTMRKIVAGLLISLDGVVEAPEKWHLRYFDDEMEDVISTAAAESDAMLLGRRTYEEFAAFWPSQGGVDPMADYMNDTPKHVVSTTLQSLEWSNSLLVNSDVANEIRLLKQQPGGNLQVTGSPTLVRSLLRDGLLDELALLLHPIVVGSGKRLFDDVDFGTVLKLVDSRTFGSGVLSLSYVPALNGEIGHDSSRTLTVVPERGA